MRFRLMLTVLVAVNADAACETGAPMGKPISFARRNPTMCSSNDAGSNEEVCTTLTVDASADGRETIKVNGGSKTYVASGLHIPKGAVFHIRTTGMEVKAKPVAWSVNSQHVFPITSGRCRLHVCTCRLIAPHSTCIHSTLPSWRMNPALTHPISKLSTLLSPLSHPQPPFFSDQAQNEPTSVSPPFCAGGNAETAANACACWCPPNHGRVNNTGSCLPLADSAPPAVCNGKSDPPSCTAEYSGKCADAIVGAAIKEQCPVMCDTCLGEKANAGKTNVNVGGGTESTDAGGNTTGGDGDVPPTPTSESSAALVVGILVPLLLIAGIAGYVISARKKEQAKRHGVTQSRGPAARNNPTFSVGNQNDDAGGGAADDTYEAPVAGAIQDDGTYEMPDDLNRDGSNQYAEVGRGAAGASAPPPLDAGDAYDMPDEFKQQGLDGGGNIKGAAVYDQAKSTQSGAVYDEASSSGQADYSLAHATTLFLDPLETDAV